MPGEKDKMNEIGRQVDDQKRRENRGAMKKEAAGELLAKKLAEEAKRDKNIALDRDPPRDWLIYASIMGS